MPQGFAFPVNHRLWVPLQLRGSGYAPLEGPALRVFGRLAGSATQEQAYAEVTALTEREAAASPETHQSLRPRVLAYGGQSPGDRSGFELLLTHVPILLVLVIACVNVGTLIYARTATRDAEIATRYALGASRARIVMQLFVEALVLAACAAAVGLAAANAALKWGVNAYYSGQDGQLPFWINPGLKPTTVLYAIAMLVIRCDVDDRPWAEPLGAAFDGDFECALTNEQQLLVDVPVRRVRHLSRRQVGRVQIDAIPGMRGAGEHLADLGRTARAHGKLCVIEEA